MKANRFRKTQDWLVSSTLAVASFVAFMGVPSNSFATPRECSDVFSGRPVFGQLRLSFKHTTTYTRKLENLGEVKDQCGFGSCHIYSWLSHLEHDFNSRNSQKIVLSNHYLVAKFYEARVFDALYSASSIDTMPSMSSAVSASQEMIRSFGVIPEEAWTGRTDFEKSDVAHRLDEYVQNIIAHAKYDRDNEPDFDKQQKIIAKARASLKRLLRSAIGDYPKSFVYQGETYTPDTFRKKYFADLDRPLVYVTNEAIEQNTISRYNDYTYFKTHVPEMSELVAATIDRGESVYLTYDHNGDFVDRARGIMSIAAFHLPVNARPLPAPMRRLMGIPIGGHAVQIVGYDRDPRTKKIRKFLVKNSWGDLSGDHGYYHMYMDYFTTYVQAISFYRDLNIPLPEAVEQN